MHATTPAPTPPETVTASPPTTTTAGLIEAEILALTAARGPDKSICPSEVARAVLPRLEQAGRGIGWQSLMTPVREVAIRLARAGRIDVLRKGRAVPAEEVRGVIRLRIKDGPA